jgi:hypothetical protein
MVWSAGGLVQRVRAALKVAKSQGGGYSVYSTGLNDRALQTLSLQVETYSA